MTTSRTPELTVYIDVKSPYAYIALEPTLALENELSLHFNWVPLTLDIPSYLGSAKKNDAGQIVESNRTKSQWSGVKYAYKDARRYATLQGRTLLGTQKIWDSSLANISISWVSDKDRIKLPTYLMNLFTPFWKRELDIENIDEISEILVSTGINIAGFEVYVHGSGKQEHDSLQASFHNRGIFGVPTYHFTDEFLFGREHLPYVKWRLTGRIGDPPDIEYPI
tara:strand:+ start:1477 stop:2145 length:669 start_codon:yes stop_codon:yes gene_type:complete